MTQAVRDTSLWAYGKLQEHIGEKQLEVYIAISRNQGCTRQELEDITGRPINTITGRVNDLMKLGLVLEGDKRPSTKPPYTMCYTLFTEEEIDYSLLRIRKKERHNKISISKKRVAIIKWLIEEMKKKCGGNLELLKEYGKDTIGQELIELDDELNMILSMQRNKAPFFNQSKGYSMFFKAPSESGSRFYDVEYNNLNNKVSCSCDAFKYAKDKMKTNYKCKHIKKVVKKFELKVNKK